MSARDLYNPPAFPCHGTMGEVVEEGMSLRDYFAIKSLPVAAQHMIDDGFKSTVNQFAELTARLAYIMADAMLAERDK